MLIDSWNSRPKRIFDFSIPDEPHPLDTSIRIRTDAEYRALYPNGYHPPMYVHTPPPVPIWVQPSSKFRPSLSASRPGLVSILKDSQPATMNPVKRIRLQRPLSTYTKPGTEDTPQGYYKRPDGTVYFMTSGATVVERGNMTGN